MPATTLAPAQTAPKSNNQTPQMLVPFSRAANEHLEPFMDVTNTIGAAAIQLQPVDIPAYGFIRGVLLEVTATGGTGTVAVAKGDAPFSAVTDVSIMDVNGAPIVGPLPGYDIFLIDKWGGYREPVGNPKLHPDFQPVQTSGNFSYLLYIPIEVNGRDGLGALANLNAASSYKLRITLADQTQVYSTNPTTLPNVRTRAWLHAWTQPQGTDLRGNPQAVEPPAHGTTSFWTRNIVNVNSGQQTIRLQRVGNLIRNLIFIYRDASGVRNKANFPAPFDIYWDTRLLREYQPITWRGQMANRIDTQAAQADESPQGLETGVYVDDYCHEFDGQIGWEMRDGWLPTVQSTRLEVIGSFGAPGTLEILTNDVSPAGEVFI